MVTAIHQALGELPHVTFVDECSVGGLNILEVITGFDVIVIVDAIRTGGRPGDFYHFTASSLRNTVNLVSIHDVNLATALELGRCLGFELPDNDSIHVFGIEISDGETFDENMSQALEQVFPELFREILEEVAVIVGVTRPQANVQ